MPKKDLDDKPIKLILKGWIEKDNEEYTNVPKICPKCGRKLGHTDALSLCGWYFVYCPYYGCRYAELYEL